MKQRILVVVAIALVAAALYPHFFVSPSSLDFTTYLPFVVNKWYAKPDRRFGVVEMAVDDATLLGLVKSNYISGQWRLPLPNDTAVFFTATERDHWSTWLLCSWSPTNGWYDENGCRQWVRDNPGMIYIVGNELAVDSPIGLGDLISAEQYSWWYYEARELIESEDSTALVAPYGPVGSVTAGLLLAVWDSYLTQFGTLLQADFYPIHHYCQPSDSSEWCWTKLAHWISWLESYRGVCWVGQDYWLTEWGLPAWAGPIPIEASLELMEGMTPLLQINTIGIMNHAWWPSCNSGWPEQCTLLVRGGQVTELGRRYLELAND